MVQRDGGCASGTSQRNRSWSSFGRVPLMHPGAETAAAWSSVSFGSASWEHAGNAPADRDVGTSVGTGAPLIAGAAAAGSTAETAHAAASQTDARTTPERRARRILT